MKTPLRVYADTSVFGGCFEENFQQASTRFFEQVRGGAFVLVISDVTLRELAPAPDYVRAVLDAVPGEHFEQIFASDESARLQTAYLAAGVVGPACENDAAHIAVATLALVDVIVSWNFKHIVHYDKIMGYEGVNSIHGYRSPRIFSPYEVIGL